MAKNTWVPWIVAACVAALTGCIGGDPVGGDEIGAGLSGAASSDLLVGDGEALGSVDEDEWGPAIPGCDGQLDGGEQFAVASGAFGLIAAVEDGHVVCVDTVEAVEEELDDTGREEEADRLVAAYQATVAMSGAEVAARFQGPNREGDPDPEPNLEALRFRMRGDPDPEPNVGQ